MANTNQTVTSIPDFFGKLSTFLQGLGWVENNSDVDRLEIAKTNNGNLLYNQFRWDDAAPNHTAIYASTGYTASPATDPGNHPGDDGGGSVDGPNDADLDNDRHVELSGASQFWCFADGTNDYAHVVVQTSLTRYVHFGFGMLDKFNDWTGGEYCYGMYNGSQSGQSAGIQRGDFTSYLLDGRSTWHNNQTFNSVVDAGALRAMPTMRVADSNGFPDNGAGGSDWAVVAGARHPFNTDVGDDRAGNQRKRCLGGFRDGYGATNFGRFAGQSLDGVIPLYEIPILYTNGTAGNGNINYFLGSMRDVRGVNMGFFQAAQQVVIGGETWQFFPVEPLATQQGSYGGVAYRVF